MTPLKPDLSIADLCAIIPRCKRLWSFCDVGSPEADALVAREQAAFEALIAKRSMSLADVVLKLSQLLDIMSEHDGSQIQLLMSTIADIEHLNRPSSLDEGPPRPAKEPAAAPKTIVPNGQIIHFAPPPPRAEIKIDRRARPIKVNGQLYGSITEAAIQTGIKYSQLQRRP